MNIFFFYSIQPFIPQSAKNAPPAIGHAEDVTIVQQKVEKVDSVVNSAAVTTEVPSLVRDEPATVQQVSEVASEPSVAPAADSQAAGPSQEEVPVDVPSNNETPASDNDTAAAPEVAQSEPEVSEPAVGGSGEAPVNSEESNSGESAKDLTVSTEAAVQEEQETSSVADTPADEPAAVAAVEPTDDPTPAVHGSSDESTGEKSEEVKAESVPENKPTESEVPGKSRSEFINFSKK